MSKFDRLPAEILAGTRTIHLPLNRAGKRPEVTLVIGRAGLQSGRFQVGVSVCSSSDAFIKALGQRAAFRRMHGKPFIGDPTTLRDAVAARLEGVNAHHPGTVSAQTILDLSSVFAELPERFQKMEQATGGSQTGHRVVQESCCGFSD